MTDKLTPQHYHFAVLCLVCNTKLDPYVRPEERIPGELDPYAPDASQYICRCKQLAVHLDVTNTLRLYVDDILTTQLIRVFDAGLEEVMPNFSNAVYVNASVRRSPIFWRNYPKGYNGSYYKDSKFVAKLREAQRYRKSLNPLHNYSFGPMTLDEYNEQPYCPQLRDYATKTRKGAFNANRYYVPPRPA